MRLFIATWPPAAIVERLAELPRDETLRARWARPDQWHVTLRFVGKIRGESLPALVGALEGVAASLPAVEAVMGPATESFGRHILHVPVAGLEQVAAAVTEATASFGVTPRDEPFSGHITLARTRRSRGGRPRGADLRSLAGTTIDGRWTVGEICLVRSHPDPGGSRFEVLHAVELGGGTHPGPSRGAHPGLKPGEVG